MPADGLQLLWGCDHRRQFERAWIEHLLSEWQLFDGPAPLRPRLLIESGLLRLERQPDPGKLEQQRQQRSFRISALAKGGPFALLHLSDEEGFDGDELYPMLPQGTQIWRNFPHLRFTRLPVPPHTFPIGPRQEFLRPIASAPASQRAWPWAFMGTIWGGGSRRLATSLFLRGLPTGFFHGGSNFATGLPLAEYQAVLASAVFALCPEGDRHLDTFRLYESLQMGCIPLVVDVRAEAMPLLGVDCEIPVFRSWQEALNFAQSMLRQPIRLDALQGSVGQWWQRRCAALASQLSATLLQQVS